jgi:hypothetical protein
MAERKEKYQPWRSLQDDHGSEEGQRDRMAQRCQLAGSPAIPAASRRRLSEVLEERNKISTFQKETRESVVHCSSRFQNKRQQDPSSEMQANSYATESSNWSTNKKSYHFNDSFGTLLRVLYGRSPTTNSSQKNKKDSWNRFRFDEFYCNVGWRESRKPQISKTFITASSPSATFSFA